MNPLNIFKKQQPADQAETVELTPLSPAKEEEETENDEIGIGTKVKVVAAVIVVGIAAYVAFWVQEPADFQGDLMGAATPVTEDLAAETVTVAAADSEFPTLTEVSIVDFTFNPANLTVEKGTVVVWTNMDPVEHTVTAESFSSEALASGDSFSYEFDETGVYDYTCSFHPQMTGKITVTEAAPPADDLTAGDETESAADIMMADESAASLDDATDEYFSALSESDSVSPGLLTVDENDVSVVADATDAAADEGEPRIVTFDAAELMADQESMHEAARAVGDSDKLAKSGPEDALYGLILLAILYLNRRKIFEALR